MKLEELNDDLPLYSKITESLWQGGTEDENTTYRGNKRLPTFGDPKPFDAVVSLCAYTLPVGWHVNELRYAFADGPLEPETVSEIEAVADWAHAKWKNGDRLLVRCQAGLNRSSLVIALILMREGMSAEESITLIRSKRSSFCLSNEHFFEYLMKR